MLDVVRILNNEASNNEPRTSSREIEKWGALLLSFFGARDNAGRAFGD